MKYFHGSLLKKYMYTLSFKDFHWTTYDSLMIYFSCEQALKSNLQIVWTNWRKNTVPSSLNIKDHKLASYFFIQKSVLKVTNLQKFVGRSTDHQNFLHVDSEHPKYLKDSIPYNQLLGTKRICTTPDNVSQYCEELKEWFINQDYKPN